MRSVKEWRYFKFQFELSDLQIMMSNQPIVGTFPPMEAFPLAWIENTGNDLPEFEFQVMNLPQGWTAVIDSPTQVVPGALKGLPINLNPPENWDKEII